MEEYYELSIKSPAGAPDELFRVVRCSEDLIKDDNRELYDCINCTLFDVEELNANKVLLNGFSAWKASGITPKFCQRQAKFHQLKYIMALCYNRAIEEPDRLNQYPPFSPQVYGETSFELIQQMVDSIPINSEDTFIDLGSGVGQVVLQVAASTNVKFSYGIEKADYPAECALIQGDFLADEYTDIIETSTIVFANNFAFGPELDYQLTLRFSRLCEGARVISSKSFCGRTIHLSSIIKLTLLDPVNDGVSWTDKPFSYYVHTIDRSPLLKYFNDLRKGQQSHRTKDRKSAGSASTAAAITSTSNSSDGSQAESTTPSVCGGEQPCTPQSRRSTNTAEARGSRKRRRRAGYRQGGKAKRCAVREVDATPNMDPSSSPAFTMAEHDGDDGDDESTMDSAQPAPLLPPPLPVMFKTEETDEFSGGTSRMTPQSGQCLQQPVGDPPTSPSPISPSTSSCSHSDCVSADSDFKVKLEPKMEPSLPSTSSSWSLLHEESPHYHQFRSSTSSALRRHPKLTKRMFLRQVGRMRHPVYAKELKNREANLKKERQNLLMSHVTRLEETIKSMHEQGRQQLAAFTNKVQCGMLHHGEEGDNGYWAEKRHVIKDVPHLWNLGMLVTTPATFFSEARKIIRHHRDLEAKIVELREELARLADFQRQMAVETQSICEHFESEEGEEDDDEPDAEAAYRPPVAKRPHYPPQLFPETEMAVLTPPILISTEEDLSPPQLTAPSIAPPRLTPIPRAHCEGTPPPPPPSPHAEEKVAHQAYRWKFACMYVCDFTTEVLPPLYRRRHYSLDAVRIEELQARLRHTPPNSNTAHPSASRIS
ncbi:Histone-lysine N-methyltransferase H3 lysine-79 specific [Taenia solium]|eukprot:TsM_000873900 transcript=TsM_000873900 gene=TsM_000873900